VAPRRRAGGRAGVTDAGVLVLAGYYDGYRRGRGPASLIQGLRDLFGAHTYRRVDREGTFHTIWSDPPEDGREGEL